MQTSYPIAQAVGRAGGLYDIATHDIITRNNASKRQVRLVPTATNSTAYSVVVNGTTYTYTSDSSATVAEITAGLAALINAGSSGASAVDNTTSMDVVSSLYSTDFVVASTGAGTLAQSDIVPPSEIVPFGCMAVQGPSDTSARLPNSAADLVAGLQMGVAVSEQNSESRLPVIGSALPVGYQQGQTMGLLRKGRIWVLAETIVKVGDTAYCRFAANGSNVQRGAFRNDTDSSNAVVVKGYFYTSTTAVNNLAVLDLNM